MQPGALTISIGGQTFVATPQAGVTTAQQQAAQSAGWAPSGGGGGESDSGFGLAAGGRFLDMSEEERERAGEVYARAGGLGISMSDAGEYSHDPGSFIIPTGKYKGYKASEAEQMEAETKGKQMGQQSVNNSFAFNPETMSGVKTASENFQLRLNDIMSSPWSSQGTKTDEVKTLVSGSADLFAKPFNTIEEFNSAYQGNPEVQKNLNAFTKAGGSLNEIAAKIQAKSAPQPVQTAQPQGNVQSTADYISSIGQVNNMDNTAASQAAEKELFPEAQLAQQEIMRQFNIPKELQKAYFGDEQTIGLLQQKKNIAEEKRRLIEQKANDAATSLRAQASLEVEKNNADLEIAKSTIEENRLTAKNYMTGMLAKLGALKTTGATPKALTTLDEKYQRQRLDAESKVAAANQQIQVQLRTKVNELESRKEDLILAIKEDLSKDGETAMKEIMKARQDADKQIYSITQGYSADLRRERERYEKEAKSASEKYIKEFADLAGKGYDADTINGIITGKKVDPLNSTGQYANINALPADIQDTVVEAILSGVTLTQLRSRFPNVSSAVLNNIWNQMTNKNTGEPVKKPATKSDASVDFDSL